MKEKNFILLRAIVSSGIFSAFLSFSLAFGYSIHKHRVNPISSLGTIASFFALLIIFTVIGVLIIYLLDRLARNRKEQKIRTVNKKKVIIRIAVAFVVMIIAWIPYWLASYPGFFTYDAGNVFVQHFYGLEYSTHHPLLHTIFIGDVFKLAVKLFPENYNMGIVFLSWIEMITGSAAFSLVLAYIYFVSGEAIYWISLAYLALFPTIGMFATCSTKDTFSSFFIIALITFILYKLNSSSKQSKVIGVIIVAVLTALVLLYRKNNLISLLIFIPIFLILVGKEWKKWLLAFAIGFILFFVCSKGLEMRYKPAKGGICEVLSVPLQQMGRTYVNVGEEMFTDEERDFFYSIHPYSLDSYHEQDADFVKNSMNDDVLRSSMPTFLKMWIRIGLHHPKEYIEAFLVNTYQAWYPFCDITSYMELADSTYTYFKCDVEAPGTLNSKLPGFYNLLWQLSREISLYKIPVIGIMFTIAFYMYMVMLTFVTGIYRKDRKTIIVSVYLITLIISALFGPLVLPRYYLYLYYAFPLMLGSIFKRQGNEPEKLNGI